MLSDMPFLRVKQTDHPKVCANILGTEKPVAFSDRPHPCNSHMGQGGCSPLIDPNGHEQVLSKKSVQLITFCWKPILCWVLYCRHWFRLEHPYYCIEKTQYRARPKNVLWCSQNPRPNRDPLGKNVAPVHRCFKQRYTAGGILKTKVWALEKPRMKGIYQAMAIRIHERFIFLFVSHVSSSQKNIVFLYSVALLGIGY